MEPDSSLSLQFGDTNDMVYFPSSLGACCVPSTPDGRFPLLAREDSEWSRSLSSNSVVQWEWDEGASPVGLRPRAWSHGSSSVTNSTLALVPGESSRFVPVKSFFSPIGRMADRVADALGMGREAGRGSLMVLRRPSAPDNSPTEVVTPAHFGSLDPQGIPWSRFSISRDDYRLRRMAEYANYNNVTWTAKLEWQRRKAIDSPTNASAALLRFHSTYRSVNPTIDHFQLRQLLWTPTNTDSYFVSNSVLYRFNRVTNGVTKIHSQVQNQMACLHVNSDFAATGGFDSEVVVTRIDSDEAIPSRSFRRKVSTADNSISNHVCLFKNESGHRLLVANNDQSLRELDIGTGGSLVSQKEFPWPVNHVSVSNCSKIACVAGDTCELALIDRINYRQIASLKGHLDFSFCSDWYGNYVATGSQDGTCRVWDCRNTLKPVTVLGALLGAVRSTRFSPCGRFLAFSEPADFVHLYRVDSLACAEEVFETNNINSGAIIGARNFDGSTCPQPSQSFKSCQVVDFFGNIAGIAFTPDSSRLSISVSDSMFGCLMTFRTN